MVPMLHKPRVSTKLLFHLGKIGLLVDKKLNEQQTADKS